MIWRHTAYLRVASQTGAGKLAYASAERMPCQISPLGSRAEMQRWGVEAKRPHLLLCPVTWEEKLTIGSVLTVAGHDYRVAAPCQPWTGSEIDCCEVLLERLTYAHVDR